MKFDKFLLETLFIQIITFRMHLSLTKISKFRVTRGIIPFVAIIDVHFHAIFTCTIIIGLTIMPVPNIYEGHVDGVYTSVPCVTIMLIFFRKKWSRECRFKRNILCTAFTEIATNAIQHNIRRNYLCQPGSRLERMSRTTAVAPVSHTSSVLPCLYICTPESRSQSSK